MITTSASPRGERGGAAGDTLSMMRRRCHPSCATILLCVAVVACTHGCFAQGSSSSLLCSEGLLSEKTLPENPGSRLCCSTECNTCGDFGFHGSKCRKRNNPLFAVCCPQAIAVRRKVCEGASDVGCLVPVDDIQGGAGGAGEPNVEKDYASSSS